MGTSMTTKTRLSSLERTISQGATMAQKPINQMTDAELSRVIGVDIRELTDNDLWKIIERNEP